MTNSDGGPALLPDVDTAIRFLNWHTPEGFWTLTAIPPDGGRTNTAQFDFETEDDCRTWLQSHHDAQDNIYFMVNPPIGPLKEKAMKEHVKELAWLHVDLDAKGDGDQTAALAAILDKLNAFYPPPSAIVMSGGGYQAFWRLNAGHFIGGNIESCEEYEAYNIQLSNVLGGDHCHNVDRIMRLPGMINVPDARKRKRGRVETPARLEGELTDRVHPLHDFKAAPRAAIGGTKSGATVRGIVLPADLPKTMNLDDLGSNVKDRTKALIVQGHDPTDPNAHGSRSEAVWAVICDLIRTGIADSVIAGILLDKDFGISAHIYDQRRPVEYTARQIGRAKEEAVHPKLREMNDKFAVVNETTRARVLFEAPDSIDPERTIWLTQSFEDFQKLEIDPVNLGTDSDGKAILKPAGKWWLSQPLRRKFAGLGCWPNQPPEYKGQFNTWRGFAYEPRPGSCELFLKHIKDNVAHGNDAHYSYILDWLAFCVQHPEKPAEVGIVLRGPMGSGKSKIGATLAKLFGHHGRHISSSGQLTGKFNSHLRDCVFFFCDEAIAPGNPQAVASLKALVTESTLSIEGKGKDIVPARNMISLMISSNDDAIVRAGARERRWAVFDMSDDHVQDFAYFNAIQEELDTGGYEALLHTLLAHNLEGRHPRQNVPQTAALRDQQELALTPEQSLLETLLDDGVLPPPGFRYDSDVHARKKPLTVKNMVYSDDLFAYARQCVPDMEKWSVTRMGRMFRKFGCESASANKLKCWRFPPLSQMRKAWEAEFWERAWSGPGVWGSVVEAHPQQEDDLETRARPPF